MKRSDLWQKARPFLFAIVVLAFLMTGFAIKEEKLFWLTGYLFSITGLILFVHYRYREHIRRITVPSLSPKLTEGNANPTSLADILLHEFDYIKDTAAQAMNDRHTLVNYFLLSTGVILAALGMVVSKEGGWEFEYRDQSLIALSLIFNALGWVYFLQIIRLRQAWCESARAMNHIKEFFARNCEYPYLIARDAFRWQPQTIPSAAKKMTVFYLSALLIAIISAAAIALATIVIIGFDKMVATKSFAIPFVLAFYHLFFQMSMYTALLQDSFKTESNEEREKKAGVETAKNSLPQAPEARKVELLKEKVVFDDFFKLVEGQLRFEKFDGEMSEEVRRLSFERGDAVVVVLHHREHRSIILIEQFRYPVYRSCQHRDGWIYELVAGMIEKGETPEEVVRREVMEEAGYRVDNIKPLASIFPSPGGASERIFVFYAVAKEQKTGGGGAAGEHEDIRVLELPVARVYEMVSKGIIQDAKTLVGLFLAKDRVLES